MLESEQKADLSAHARSSGSPLPDQPTATFSSFCFAFQSGLAHHALMPLCMDWLSAAMRN
jgi:hypothetical protein